MIDMVNEKTFVPKVKNDQTPHPPIGWYEPVKKQWAVYLGDGSWFTTKKQADAHMISMLAKIAAKVGVGENVEIYEDGTEKVIE
jgi:hypothetical protein